MRMVLAVFAALACAVPLVAQQQEANTPAVIERVDKAFADAMVKGDLGALGKTYADDYVFTDPTGRVSHKAELLESFRRGVIHIRSQEISDVQVNVYGEVGAEIGKLMSQATRDGKASGGTSLFTGVGVKPDGRGRRA